MSGFRSSAPDATPAAPGERSAPLSLTVHSMPEPRAERDRTLSGRLKMGLILLACAAPVLASYFTYYVIRPQARANYGELIQPTRALPPALALTALDGSAVAAPTLRGQWLLITVGSGDCDAACEKRLYLQRQLREMLGREKDRLDRVWLLTDAAEPRAPLREAFDTAQGGIALRVSEAELQRWLQPETGRSLQEHLYLVDPMGEWMMRMPADPEPARVRRDLERLLRASASWDRAGR